MTHSNMTDEAAAAVNGVTCRTLCRKRQSPGGGSSSSCGGGGFSGVGAGMDEATRNGMRKYYRHETTLTLRALMAGKEVGTIIGRHGENIKALRSQTGACVKISDGSSPERIITVSGSLQQVIKAFECICQTFEDDHQRSTARLVENKLVQEVPCPPITLRLLIPEHHCGSIIGKGGTKIRRIREVTGAHIQVAAQVLPNSSDRPITLSGTAKSVSLSVKQLCQVFVRICFQDIGVPYQPQPTYGVPPTSPIGCPRDPTFLCDQLSCSPLPAITTDPVVLPVSPDLLFYHPSLHPPYWDHSPTLTLGSPIPLLYPPESIFSIPLFVPTLISATNPTSSLPYSSLPLACQSSLKSKNYELPTTTPGFMSNLQGNIYSTAQSLTQAEALNVPPDHPVIPRLNLPADTGQVGLGPSNVGMPGVDQQHRVLDQLTEKLPLVRELEQLVGCSTTAPAGTVGTTDRLDGTAAGADRVYQALLTATQPALGLLGDQKQALSLQQPFQTTSFVRTPDQLLNVPCPQTPAVRNVPQETQHRVEMFLPNDIVGCIIGRGGNKINEIRQMSQATIKISSGEDGMAERRITITGTSAAIKTAQTMINNSIELHKHLVALNMAMNCFYTSPNESYDPSRRTRALSNLPALRSANPGPIGSDASTLSHADPRTGCYLRSNSVALSNINLSAILDKNPIEIRSAPAQLGVANRADFTVQPNTPFIIPTVHSSRKGSVAQTASPYTGTPFLSATQLERSKRSYSNVYRPIDTSNHHQQILELIRQLPRDDQQKWLTAFGLNTGTSFASSN